MLLAMYAFLPLEAGSQTINIPEGLIDTWLM